MPSPSRPTGVLHYETSRTAREQPPQQELGRAGRLRMSRTYEPWHLADLVPWAFVIIIGIIGAGGLEAANVGPDACMNHGISWGQEEGASWHGESVVWPPGVRCVVTDGAGETRSFAPGYGHVVAAALTVALMAAGFFRPPSPAWRRAAQVASVPALLVGMLLVGIVFDGPSGVVVAWMLLMAALVPALITWMALYALTEWPAGWVFVGSWLGWVATIGAGFVLPAIT